MTPEQRFRLIKRNTEEIITEQELKELLQKKKKPSVYLGTAITGKPHIGYFMWVLKLADFLKAGFKVKLLLADLHGALDGTPWSLLEKRYKYYARVIPLMFKSIGADIKDFEIIKGSDFQKKQEYQFGILRMSTEASINDCRRAASEVVKFGDNPKLCGLIYPIMQALDEIYLKVDIQYGGIDQRKMLMFAREFLPKIGCTRQIEVMTPMIPGLVGGKMSASDPHSKIDLADDENTVEDKIRRAYCEPGIIENNGILAFTKYIIMILKQDRNEKFVVERPEKFGGNIEFRAYEEIEQAYKTKKLHPLDLKNTVAKEINKLLAPFRKQKKEIEKIAKQAYPK